MTDTLILTGWGWKEYAVAAAVALKAHHGDADVRGVSKRRLPELLEELDVRGNITAYQHLEKLDTTGSL